MPYSGNGFVRPDLNGPELQHKLLVLVIYGTFFMVRVPCWVQNGIFLSKVVYFVVDMSK